MVDLNRLPKIFSTKNVTRRSKLRIFEILILIQKMNN